jgi:hypothetical protein
MDHLLTVASDEFGTQGRWLPWEDREDPKITSERSIGDRDAWAPHGLMLGDVGSLYLFTCPVCAERPLAGTMQSADQRRPRSENAKRQASDLLLLVEVGRLELWPAS